MRYDERKEAEAFERGLNIGRLEAAKDLAAAEERGRRSGVEEHKALKAAHEYCLYMFEREWLTDERNRSIFAAHIFAILDRALAPRDSAPAKMDASGGPRCWCGKPSVHQSGWCGGLACQGGAPRDSGKEST